MVCVALPGVYIEGLPKYNNGARESKAGGTTPQRIQLEAPPVSLGGRQHGPQSNERNIFGEGKALLGVGWPCKSPGLGGARGGSPEAGEEGGPREGEGGGAQAGEGVQAGSQLPGRVTGSRPTSGWV